ncbi:MAG: enoyl-CoA hydratase/isomerase family protein [Actinomycetota bacterium]
MSVTYEVRHDVAVITLDRPERFNAVTQDLSEGLVSSLARAGEEARAAVLTGAGKAFCSGADLSDLMDDYGRGGPDLDPVIARRFNPMVEALLACEVPTVAAVNGAAAGAGMGLALACDLRVMGESAFFLSAFVGLALIPDTGSTWLLRHHLGLSRAIEFTYSNRRMPAAEAKDLGLASDVVPDGEVVDRAREVAAGLAEGPTDAYVATRRLLVGAGHAEPPVALAEERRIQAELGTSPAHLEGMRAFLEKRPPDFRNPAT